MNKNGTVTTPQEAGLRGYYALLAKYGTRQVAAWRRKGGRRPNRTLQEIEAGIVRQRARPVRSRTGGEPTNNG